MQEEEPRDYTIASKVTQTTGDRLDKIASEENKTKSRTIQDLIREGLEKRDGEDNDDDRAAGRSVSALTVLGIVSIALAPTMLATGQVVVGAFLSMVAGVYGLLWATAKDHIVEAAIADARSTIREAGGPLALFRRLFRDDRVVDDPDTVVERLTFADVTAVTVTFFTILLAAPLIAVSSLGLTETFINWAGPFPSLAYIAVITLLIYLILFLFGVSSIASIAVMTSEPTPAGDDADAGADVDPEVQP